MRNLLEEFNEDHGVRAPTILGFREHIFTGRYLGNLVIISFLLSYSVSFFLLADISMYLQCFFFGLVYVKSRNKLRDHWAASPGKSPKVCHGVPSFILHNIA